jgi:hypothetical protein
MLQHSNPRFVLQLVVVHWWRLGDWILSRGHKTAFDVDAAVPAVFLGAAKGSFK